MSDQIILFPLQDNVMLVPFNNFSSKKRNFKKPKIGVILYILNMCHCTMYFCNFVKMYF